MIAFNKIFGIGLERTGTTSLTVALQILGIKTLHASPYILGVIETEKKLKVKPLSTVPEYRAFTDNPFPKMYKELDEVYPGSKFIVTHRDFDSWLKSKITLSVWQRKAFGVKRFDQVTVDRASFKRTFDEHHNKIKKYFEGRNDIVWIHLDEVDKWKKLCDFLKTRRPDVPFPHKNISNILK